MEEMVTGTSWGRGPTKKDRGILGFSRIDIATSRHQPPKGTGPGLPQPSACCWRATDGGQGAGAWAGCSARAGTPAETGSRAPHWGCRQEGTAVQAQETLALSLWPIPPPLGLTLLRSPMTTQATETLHCGSRREATGVRRPTFISDITYSCAGPGWGPGLGSALADTCQRIAAHQR